MAISLYLKSWSLSLYLQLETTSDKILIVSGILSELKASHELYSLRIFFPPLRGWRQLRDENQQKR